MSPLDPNFIRRVLEEKMAERRQRIVVWTVAVCSAFFLVGIFYIQFAMPPAEFRSKSIVAIKENSGLNQIVQTLYERKIIKSPFWFRTLVIAVAGQRGVMAGDYYFERPVGIWGVASRLTSGNFGLTPVRVTFPEGMTAKQMSLILADQLIEFDTDSFLALAKLQEGYLFPDTYFFAPNAKPQAIIDAMRKNFDSKIKTLDIVIKAFGKQTKDVVIIASILEAEARTTETRETIAGILWKRLSLGMPLQVDAPFEYVIGKNTFQLTAADLQYDSPYNTYKYKGLPPTAIGNPGLDALTAAVNPVKSPYFYYLSDIRGTMHYAKTYEEHLANKEKYLR